MLAICPLIVTESLILKMLAICPLIVTESLILLNPHMCNAPNFAVEFFFFSLLAKIRALPFLFLFPLAKP
jgi:hypothetical protein